METNPTIPNKAIRRHRRRRAGQSLVEMALAMPVLLIMLTGMLEFGFALNYYLNTLDAAREGARFASDGDPSERQDTPQEVLAAADVTERCNGVGYEDMFTSAPVTLTEVTDFYIQAACVAWQTMAPVSLDPTRDDVVISVFRVLDGQVRGRWPDCTKDDPEDCPRDPPTFPETRGEWHLFGRGNQCTNDQDDDGDGAVDDCHPDPAFQIGDNEDACDTSTELLCHPSRFSWADVQGRLDDDAPNTAVMLVEIFYGYHQLLKLPWITAFVDDPLRMHTYTMIPVPAAEPTLAITGTVTYEVGGLPQAGVTINFSNGLVGVTDDTGLYEKGGFESGTFRVTPDYPGCTFDPPYWDITLSTVDVGYVDFEIVSCAPTDTPVTPATATETEDPAATRTPTSTQTETPTPTETETPTITPTPSNTPDCTLGVFSPGNSSVVIVQPPTGEVQADGAETVEVAVVARDECFNAMDNHPISLASSRGALDTISPASTTTAPGTGLATFLVKSSTMSDWNSATGVFTPTTLTASSSGTPLPDTSEATFLCVPGVGFPAGGANEVFWQYSNLTGITRRLTRLEVTWPQETGRRLQDVRLGGLVIWNLSSTISPVTIDSNFLGGPTARHINISVSKPLQINFNFNVTGNQEYTVKAFWDDTNGGKVCDSGPVTIVRVGGITPVPSATPTNTPAPPTNTPTVTPTPTDTLVPTETGTPTPTDTPTETPTPTATNTP